MNLITLLSVLGNYSTGNIPMPDENNLTPGTSRGNATGHGGQMEEMFNIIGTSMMKDGFAAKLLAYVYWANDERCVLHTGMKAGIEMAQQKFNLYGGEVPNIKLLPLLQKYMKDINKRGEKCEWLQEIYDRYEIQSIFKAK